MDGAATEGATAVGASTAALTAGPRGCDVEVVVVVVVVVAALLAVPLVVFNRLVKLRNRVASTWSDLDVQLVRRAELVPNLVQVVKGYAAYERSVIEAVTDARRHLAGADGAPADRAAAEDDLGRRVDQLMAVAEGYPDLKADERFRQLSDELTATENTIAFSRQLYNDTVDAYRTAAQSFPGVLFAGSFGFRPPDYFMPRGSGWADDHAARVHGEDLR